MYEWLMYHKIFGAYLYSYLTYKAIPGKAKIRSLFLLWPALIVSMLLLSSTHMSILLTAVGVGVTVHLITLKTLSQEELKRVHSMMMIHDKKCFASERSHDEK